MVGMHGNAPTSIKVPAHHNRELSADFAGRLEDVANHLSPRDRRCLDVLLSQVRRNVVGDGELVFAQYQLEELRAGQHYVDTDLSKVPPAIMEKADAIAAEIRKVRAPSTMDRALERIEHVGLSLQRAVAGLYQRARYALRGP
jgi:hypothetical protein